MSFRKDKRNASDSKVPRTVSLFLLDNSLDEAILFTWGFPYQHDALRDFPIGSGNTRATKWLYMLCSSKGAAVAYLTYYSGSAWSQHCHGKEAS